LSAIYLLPLGNADRTLVEGLRSPVQEAFQVPVEIRNTSIDPAPFYDASRVQYNSTQILQFLQRNLREVGSAQSSPNSPSSKLLAILPQDLFIPILTYVFGEAELDGSVAVVSYYRFMNERYGLPQDNRLLAARLRKEALHELGHAYGLVHCVEQQCVMHTSTYVEDIDLKSDAFCPECAQAILHRKRHTSVKTHKK
jgi:archaemetzincin